MLQRGVLSAVLVGVTMLRVVIVLVVMMHVTFLAV
jgi:hypothetical protein